MYSDWFEQKRQDKMRQFFLKLSKEGIIKSYNKNEIIDIESGEYVVIVVEGILSVEIISSMGNEKLLYVLRPGEIYGEMSYFCGGRCVTILKAKEKSKIALVKRDILETVLENEPEIYRYFIHSITRKFRIVMLQLTSAIFNDSIGKIADTLLRLASCSEKNPDEEVSISVSYTHQELANNVGCSRITITRCLNRFISEGIIDIKNKRIIIKDIDKLQSYVDKII
ncbi:Crp/Fnr family transcriptional regulator [Caloramator proteoclasticus]|uniref:cAMP-binding domain of CRP or a regulatory subunit of cAMP-dependent protein kinases n=1 Tax=Caloramator proteoclasticus DSM 10124 TaxID=1121262 RepID=A0A1M4XKB1_9CLOT|nr:Crp/Fnr family transcriptional regulator [Caloramator proteoclasticus]SHE93703.1 cAMP-binding domain of CRP or a regulatory subunit of cAMP-dependent protein kinases [Caloramator proteoclasticus DSM 10124]